MGKMEEGNKTFCHSYNTEKLHIFYYTEAKKRQTKAAPISFVERAQRCTGGQSLMLTLPLTPAINFTDIAVTVVKVSSKFH